ncbi:salicylic acid-binding protein 2-like, partial [Jatropha curcas]|uniref:salicylic acid-binding protein 2-like n=1 Tax=Jatropha curcas TaxID=180498 RepID=UPI0009D6A4A4
ILAVNFLFNFPSHDRKCSFIQAEEGKHFLLVHGASHGSWSWYKIVPLLRLSGHEVTTIDFAAYGIDPQQPKSLQSVSDYILPVNDFVASLPPQQRVVLVGHSFGGFAVSQVMEHFPNKISVAVFLNACMPGPTFNVSTLLKEYGSREVPELDNSYTYDDGPRNPPATVALGPIFLKNTVYQFSPIEDWTLATSLVRPRRLFSEQDMSKELMLTWKNYGSVRKVFIISEQDMIIKKDFQELMTKKNPPKEVLKMEGSDHMVMMSKPVDLCAFLLRIAVKYN